MPEMFPFFAECVCSQPLGPFYELRVVGNDHSPFTSRNYFVSVETKTSHVSQPSGAFTFVFCSVCFSGVLDHDQVMLACDLCNCVHVRGVTIGMNRDYRARSFRDFLLNLRSIHVPRFE